MYIDRGSKMTTDLTFITNEEGKRLVDRFSHLIKDTRFFDCLVGYFRATGFHELYESLEKTEKIRVLIGISTGKKAYDLIQESREEESLDNFYRSSKEIKKSISSKTIEEFEYSKDSKKVEKGAKKFVEWLKSGKLEIRAYPTKKIHAKLYIMTFRRGDRDDGRVITGSSNFTKSGLKDNLEFNVELKNISDYEFSLEKFNELWENSVDVSEKYVDIIKKKTWLNKEITPYDLYLKFLYEYLREKINIDKRELFEEGLPENVMDLEYQKDAVRDAKMKLEEYGGVFVSDVVGLGKTYIAAILAKELDGGTLVIAPPNLLNRDSPGSWPNVFLDVRVSAHFQSIGKLDKVLSRDPSKYKNIIIDESHRFRNEMTQMYEKLFEICRGKRIILVSATPMNNTPLDILSQIKLFQRAHRSTLPNPKVRDLERYFKRLHRRVKNLDRVKDKEKYIEVVQENARSIRKNVLRHLMVRRTRSSIIKYYKKDLEKQGLKFPEVKKPKPILYHFDGKLDEIFDKTLELIMKKFKYARYTPLLYLKKDISQPEELSQKNMGGFMKILLLKRLESSFFAFKKSINRFIHAYDRFIEEYEKGQVFTSKKHINKIFELLESDNDEAVQKLIEEDKAQRYSSEEFKSNFIKHLKHDREILEQIENMWREVNHDPKLEKFIELLKQDNILKKHKLLVFTESKETAEYVEKNLDPEFENKVMAISGDSSEYERKKVIDNYDANLPKKKQKDDIRILISTDLLSEGVSLHRSNVVINYDIPWNPVKMMQRVGRVNRVSKSPPFDNIYTYNFFPAGPINKNIGLKEAAEAKIKTFIEMLGNDAKLLTDEEIKSHDLFTKLASKELIVGEDEEDPELKYLKLLRDIRDNDKKLFERIKRLPKKARTAKKYEENYNSLLTFFRKGKLRKIYQSGNKEVKELEFSEAAEILESKKNVKREKLGDDFYEYLEENKKEFNRVFTDLSGELKSPGGRSHEAKMIKILKAIRNSEEFTEEDEEYLQDFYMLLKEGGIAKKTVKKILEKIERETNPLKILARIRAGVSPLLFKENLAGTAADLSGPKEVILSEYLVGK